MVANIIGIAVLVLWVVFVIFTIVYRIRESKKKGLPPSCIGCASLKNGSCSKECNAASTKFFEEKHKEFLEKQNNQESN